MLLRETSRIWMRKFQGYMAHDESIEPCLAWFWGVLGFRENQDLRALLSGVYQSETILMVFLFCGSVQPKFCYYTLKTGKPLNP